MDDFSQSKNIQIIGTPKTIGQAKITGSTIENIINEDPNTTLDKVAVDEIVQEFYVKDSIKILNCIFNVFRIFIRN